VAPPPPPLPLLPLLLLLLRRQLCRQCPLSRPQRHRQEQQQLQQVLVLVLVWQAPLLQRRPLPLGWLRSIKEAPVQHHSTRLAGHDVPLVVGGICLVSHACM
jgi:hypothetical protein